MKRIVTHRNPHLDEIMCIWMVQRFLPGWGACAVGYIPTNPKGGRVAAPDSDADTMYIGVGRGKFDEHKGNLSDSATTLVHSFLMRQRAVKLGVVEKKALLELVRFVNDDDHGLHIMLPYGEFMFSAAASYLPKAHYSSQKILAAGRAYLDGVFECLLEKHTLARDWRRVRRVKTKWGTAVVLKTAVSPKIVLRHAAGEGVKIAVVVNPENNFRSIRATPESRVDLIHAFERAHAAEPSAEWYLHHSKKMLICGSNVAENATLSRLSLTQLEKLVAV